MKKRYVWISITVFVVLIFFVAIIRIDIGNRNSTGAVSESYTENRNAEEEASAEKNAEASPASSENTEPVIQEKISGEAEDDLTSGIMPLPKEAEPEAAAESEDIKKRKEIEVTENLPESGPEGEEVSTFPAEENNGSESEEKTDISVLSPVPVSEAEWEGCILKKERTSYFNSKGAASGGFDPEGTVLVQRLMEDGSLFIYKWNKGEWTWDVQIR